MAQDNQIIAEIIVEGADQFKAQLQSSRKEVQAFDDDQKELNNTLVDAKNKLKDLETQGKANTQEYKKLENETRAVEISMQSQGKATDSLRTQQRKLKEEYADLRIKLEQLEKANLKGTDSYKLLEQRMQVVQQEAGSLNDLMGDVSSEISQLGSDTQGIDKTLRGVTALAGGFSAVQGVMALFGSENEAIEKTLLKVNAAMAIASGTQQLFTELRAKDSIFIAIQGKAQKLLNLVIGQGTIVTKLFRVALTAIGIGLVITLISALVANFDKFKKVLFNIFPPLKNLGANFDVIKDKVITFVKGAVLSFINSFIEAYNSSLLLRYAISVVGATFQSVGDVIVTIAKNIGAVFTTLWSVISDPKNAITNLKKGFNQIVTNFKDLGKNVYDNFSQGLENAKKSKLNLIDMDKLFPKSSKATDKGKEIGTDIKKGAKDEIEDKPLEVQIDVSPQVSFVGESLKLQIEDLKKEIQFLFNDIFTSGEVPLANPQLQSLLAQLKEAEENLKIFEDAYNAIFEQFTDDGVQLPPLLDEFDIDNFTSSIGELTSIGKDKYKEYYDYIQSLREQDIINEEIANDAIQKLNESRQNTIIERANVAKNIYSEFANVITGITDTISQASKQRYEQDVSELEQKKERGIISEKQYQREVAKLQKEQALREYRINVTKAFMQVPMVVLNALTTVPFPANIVLATLYGGIALAQAALVAKNKPKFRHGGFADRIFKGSGKVVGKSHAQGGVNAELEGNEYVMQGKAVSFYGQDFMKAVNNMNYQPPTLKTKDIYYPKEDKLSSKLDLIASYTKQSYKTVEKSNQLLSSINQNTKTGKNARV